MTEEQVVDKLRAIQAMMSALSDNLFTCAIRRQVNKNQAEEMIAKADWIKAELEDFFYKGG